MTPGFSGPHAGWLSDWISEYPIHSGDVFAISKGENEMDNMITGVLSAGLFIAFVAGLAESIGALPFMFIVGVVSIMLLIDLVQSIKQGFSKSDGQKDE